MFCKQIKAWDHIPWRKKYIAKESRGPYSRFICRRLIFPLQFTLARPSQIFIVSFPSFSLADAQDFPTRSTFYVSKPLSAFSYIQNIPIEKAKEGHKPYQSAKEILVKTRSSSHLWVSYFLNTLCIQYLPNRPAPCLLLLAQWCSRQVEGGQ